MDKLVKIGKIAKPHGVRGTLKVLSLTDDKTRYNKLKKSTFRHVTVLKNLIF